MLTGSNYISSCMKKSICSVHFRTDPLKILDRLVSHELTTPDTFQVLKCVLKPSCHTLLHLTFEFLSIQGGED